MTDKPLDAPQDELFRLAQEQLGWEPLRFFVHDRGMLELADYLQACDRYSAYEVTLEDFDSKVRVTDLLYRIRFLAGPIYGFSQDFRGGEAALEDNDTDLAVESVETLNDDEFAALKDCQREWFAGEVGDYEMDSSDIVRPISGQQWAFRLFDREVDPEILDEFGIVIVEGEHPGSTYLAAELRTSVEDANFVAQRLGLPIVFERVVSPWAR